MIAGRVLKLVLLIVHVHVLVLVTAERRTRFPNELLDCEPAICP